MIDVGKMNLNEKCDYIFAEHQSQMFPGGRFAWIDSLLGDIRTFLDGIESYLQSKSTGRGGGNVSVPILLSTALELVSALYVGKTDYMEHANTISKGTYNAEDNVKQFVKRFFPEPYNKFPLLMWDGVRNGVTHLFSPKPLQYQQEIIRFQFAVEDKDASSYAAKDTNTIFVMINDFELYEVFKRAIEAYRKELTGNQELQDKFISAWHSIETYVRSIDPSDSGKSGEARALIAEIEKSNNHMVLRLQSPSENIAKVQQPTPPSVHLPTANTTL